MTTATTILDAPPRARASKRVVHPVSRTDRGTTSAFETKRHGERCSVITVTTELDFISAKELVKAIVRAAASSDGVVIDLVACGFCDSASLAAMAKQKYVLRDRLQFVVGAGGPVRRAFEVTGLSGASTMHASVDAALAALRSSYERA